MNDDTISEQKKADMIAGYRRQLITSIPQHRRDDRRRHVRRYQSHVAGRLECAALSVRLLRLAQPDGVALPILRSATVSARLDDYGPIKPSTQRHRAHRERCRKKRICAFPNCRAKLDPVADWNARRVAFYQNCEKCRAAHAAKEIERGRQRITNYSTEPQP